MTNTGIYITIRQQTTTKELPIMKTDIISVRIDHDAKIAFNQICDDIGLSSSQAIKLFTKAVINYGGIPFELRRPQPNRMTIQAIEELEQGGGHKTHSTQGLFNELGLDIPNA